MNDPVLFERTRSGGEISIIPTCRFKSEKDRQNNRVRWSISFRATMVRHTISGEKTEYFFPTEESFNQLKTRNNYPQATIESYIEESFTRHLCYTIGRVLTEEHKQLLTKKIVEKWKVINPDETPIILFKEAQEKLTKLFDGETKTRTKAFQRAVRIANAKELHPDAISQMSALLPEMTKEELTEIGRFIERVHDLLMQKNRKQMPGSF